MEYTPENMKQDKNKKTLLFTSRGVGSRERHLLLDLLSLIPHTKKETKFDTKKEIDFINEMLEVEDAENAIFLECRKRGVDSYLWLNDTVNGPSAKFHLVNFQTIQELNTIGNCSKDSRALLSFEKEFDTDPQNIVMKNLFIRTFGTPSSHKKISNFYDHLFHFSLADKHVWIRSYQITKNEKEEIFLIEIGPRLVLEPIKIFEESFSGKVIWSNQDYVSPSQKRSNLKKKNYAEKIHNKIRKENKISAISFKEDKRMDIYN